MRQLIQKMPRLAAGPVIWMVFLISHLCFIGIADVDRSEERVAMRVSQGGHDVPTDKLMARFPRTLTNLRQAIRELPCVFIFDNDDLREPYRLAAVFQNGQRSLLAKPIPDWLESIP